MHLTLLFFKIKLQKKYDKAVPYHMILMTWWSYVRFGSSEVTRGVGPNLVGVVWISLKIGMCFHLLGIHVLN
jgi:hypothetical protein